MMTNQIFTYLIRLVRFLPITLCNICLEEDILVLGWVLERQRLKRLEQDEA